MLNHGQHSDHLGVLPEWSQTGYLGFGGCFEVNVFLSLSRDAYIVPSALHQGRVIISLAAPLSYFVATAVNELGVLNLVQHGKNAGNIHGDRILWLEKNSPTVLVWLLQAAMLTYGAQSQLEGRNRAMRSFRLWVRDLKWCSIPPKSLQNPSKALADSACRRSGSDYRRTTVPL